MAKIEKIAEIKTRDKKLRKKLQKFMLNSGFFIQEVADNKSEKTFYVLREKTMKSEFH